MEVKESSIGPKDTAEGPECVGFAKWPKMAFGKQEPALEAICKYVAIFGLPWQQLTVFQGQGNVVWQA